MAVLLSTGSEIMLLDTGFVTPMQDCAIIFYNGNPPADPDDALPAGNQRIAIGARANTWTGGSGTGEGIPWDAANASGIVVPTDPIADIKLFAEVTGVVRWGWMINDVAGAENEGASATLVRIQGVAGIGNGDFKLSNTSITAGQTYTLDVGTFRFPA